MKILQHPRDTTEINDEYIGPASQLTVDLERMELRLHDGVTPGGFRILNLVQLLLMFMSKDSELGEVDFEDDDRGYMVRTGVRQYTLREIKALADGGITVANGKATGDNTALSVDTTWLNKQLLGLFAGKLRFLGVTTGVAEALILESGNTTDWANVDGAVGIFQVHISPALGATLKVDASGTARPLVWLNGSNDLTNGLVAGDNLLVVQLAGAYFILGTQNAKTTRIKTITGLAATEVQTALELLLARIKVLEDADDPDAPVLPGYQSYGALTQFLAGPWDYAAHLPADGDSCIFQYFQQSGGGREQTVTLTQLLYVMKAGGQHYVGELGTLDNTGGGFTRVGAAYDPASLIAPPPNLVPISILNNNFLLRGAISAKRPV